MAFSLVELVIVVVIVGVLAAIALPRLSRSVMINEDRAIDQQFRMIAKAADMYAAENDGQYPPDEVARTIPPGLAPYLPANAFDNTYWGNGWDWNQASGPEWTGLPPAIVFWGGNAERITQFDQNVDDGNTSTGDYYLFRDGLVYWILPPGF